MKKFRSPYVCGLEMKMPHEESKAIDFTMKGAQNYAGVKFY